MQQKINKLIETNNIVKCSDTVLYFPNERERKMDGFHEPISKDTFKEERKKIEEGNKGRRYSEVHDIGYGGYIGYCAPNWSKRVFYILQQLKELEEQDKIAYYEKWLEVRVARSKNRNVVEKEEIEIMERIKEQFDERKGSKKIDKEQEI